MYQCWVTPNYVCGTCRHQHISALIMLHYCVKQCVMFVLYPYRWWHCVPVSVHGYRCSRDSFQVEQIRCGIWAQPVSDWCHREATSGRPYRVFLWCVPPLAADIHTSETSQLVIPCQSVTFSICWGGGISWIHPKYILWHQLVLQYYPRNF